MAGDLVPAKALVANLNTIITDFENRYGAQGIAMFDLARTAADGESVGNYAVNDLRSLYAALNIRVNNLRDSP